MACLHNQIVVHKCYIPNLHFFCNSLGCFPKFKNVCWVARVYATMTFCLTQRHSLCYFDHNNSALLQGAASLSKMAKSSFERHQNFNDVWCHRHQSLSMTIFVIVIIICLHRHNHFLPFFPSFSPLKCHFSACYS